MLPKDVPKIWLNSKPKKLIQTFCIHPNSPYNIFMPYNSHEMNLIQSNSILSGHPRRQIFVSVAEGRVEARKIARLIGVV